MWNQNKDAYLGGGKYYLWWKPGWPEKTCDLSKNNSILLSYIELIT